MAELGDERAAPSIAAYQQSRAFLTLPDQGHFQSSRSTYDFKRHTRGTEGTLRGCPQIVGHSLQRSDSDLLLAREFEDGISQPEKRTDGNDVSAMSLQIKKRPTHSRSRIDNIIHERHTFPFDGWLQRFRQTVVDRK
jgi:hypothetical protein